MYNAVTDFGVSSILGKIIPSMFPFCTTKPQEIFYDNMVISVMMQGAGVGASNLINN